MKRSKRLKTLVELQGKLAALHEMRHAGYIARANQAAEEAADLARRAETGSPITDLFPDLYPRRILMANARESVNRVEAGREARMIATHTLRGKTVERAMREARAEEERESAEKDRIEAISRRFHEF
ncbi:MAG: hypothetical protein K5872_12285 [Rhizobiaceae bacterium]|nr:hypothetical protein [Rhizobiaceae bacterium]MCV0406995.1 hypothetical protein [Rhizobiaceae bacterium]